MIWHVKIFRTILLKAYFCFRTERQLLFPFLHKTIFKQEYIASFEVKELESQIQAAKRKVREASEAVTENAKKAMTQFVEKSPRVAINMSISSPVILVPERSDSLKALMFDFGHLDIRNIFCRDQTSAKSTVILDSITIELKSMKIARWVHMQFSSC